MGAGGGEGIIVAAYAPGDEDAVTALILPIQQAEFGVAVTLSDQPDLKDIPGFYQTGRGGFWVAKADGRVVGTIALKDIGGTDAALRKMFVAADYRGAAFGVAAQLLDTLVAEARQAGVKRLFLGTTEAFKAAHRFYEKNGFVEIAKDDLPPAFPVMAVDSKFYLRNLTVG